MIIVKEILDLKTRVDNVTQELNLIESDIENLYVSTETLNVDFIDLRNTVETLAENSTASRNYLVTIGAWGYDSVTTGIKSIVTTPNAQLASLGITETITVLYTDDNLPNLEIISSVGFNPNGLNFSYSGPDILLTDITLNPTTDSIQCTYRIMPDPVTGASLITPSRTVYMDLAIFYKK